MTRQIAVVLSVLGVVAFSFCTDSFAKSRSKIHGSISAKGKSKSEYSSLAKISLQDAIVAATKSTSGKVLEAALDREDGFLVYEVEVLMPNHLKKEVLVDAGTGEILFTKEKNIKSDDDDDEEDEE